MPVDDDAAETAGSSRGPAVLGASNSRRRDKGAGGDAAGALGASQSNATAPPANDVPDDRHSAVDHPYALSTLATAHSGHRQGQYPLYASPEKVRTRQTPGGY
jgi:hypothetical protein